MKTEFFVNWKVQRRSRSSLLLEVCFGSPVSTGSAMRSSPLRVRITEQRLDYGQEPWDYRVVDGDGIVAFQK